MGKIIDYNRFPVLIKASFGGGGRGLRIVRDAAELRGLVDSSREESRKGFGKDEILLEKYLENTRHIEVQVLGDKFGNVKELCTRDCTVQRKFQKLIEEAPAVILTLKIV